MKKKKQIVTIEDGLRYVKKLTLFKRELELIGVPIIIIKSKIPLKKMRKPWTLNPWDIMSNYIIYDKLKLTFLDRINLLTLFFNVFKGVDFAKINKYTHDNN